MWLIILIITGGRVIIVVQLGVLNARDVHDARKAVAFSVPLGNTLFKERIEATLGKSVGYIARGRPKQGLLCDATIANYSHVLPSP
jgi:hypothetical protein